MSFFFQFGRFNEEDFDAYIVSTPPKTHFEIAKNIINRNKPLLVEKPLTLDLNESIELNNLQKIMLI